MKHNFLKNNHGFTLVETLVAVAILSLSLLAGFTAVQSSLQNSNLTEDQITAFFLTQESVEFIKNIRDENALRNLGGTPTTWLHLMSEVNTDPCYFGNVCRIDVVAKTMVYCGTTAGSCPVLNQNTTPSSSTYLLYGYTNGWTPTRFKREIQFQSIQPDEVRVTTTVSWTKGNKNYTFQTSQLLFNHE